MKSISFVFILRLMCGYKSIKRKRHIIIAEVFLPTKAPSSLSIGRGGDGCCALSTNTYRVAGKVSTSVVNIFEYLLHTRHCTNCFECTI